MELVLVTRSFVFGAGPLFVRMGVGRPRDDIDETVSKELSLCGMVGTTSAAASRPFLVVVPLAEREPSENRPFALGADATRRMNRVAFAPSTFGDRGLARDAEGGDGGMNDICDAFAVCGIRDLPSRNLSALMVPRSLPSSSPSLIVSIPSPGCCEK